MLGRENKMSRNEASKRSSLLHALATPSQKRGERRAASCVERNADSRTDPSAMEEPRECPSCALEYDAADDPEVCPYCGYEFPKQKSYVPWVAILFALLMLAFLVF